MTRGGEGRLERADDKLPRGRLIEVARAALAWQVQGDLDCWESCAATHERLDRAIDALFGARDD